MELSAVVAANALLGYSPDPPTLDQPGGGSPGLPREFLLGELGRALFDDARRTFEKLKQSRSH
jgi:hypothetical protein